MERARKRRVLDDGNIVFQGDFADAKRDVVDALGDADRRRHFIQLVFQRHRVMSRVGNHHRGLGHRLHHALLRAFAPDLAQPAADYGIALGLLHFFLDLMARHLHLLQMLHLLEQEIEQGDDADNPQHADHQANRDRMYVAQDLQRLQTQGLLDPVHLGPHQRYRNRSDDGDLDQALEQLDHGFDREHALEALEN